MKHLIADADFKPHWVEKLDADIYHSDRRFVSRSQLVKANRSLLKFKRSFDDQEEVKETKALKFGTLVHLAILEGPVFLEQYVVQPDFGPMQSSRNRAERDAWREEAEAMGQLIVTQKELDTLHGMIESVMAHPDAFALLKDCVTELTGFFADPESKIKYRFRADFLNRGLTILGDVKSTEDCSKEAFKKSIINYGYDFQIAMYAHGVKCITGKAPDYSAFIAIEKEPPYECAVYIVDAGTMDLGLDKFRRANKKLFNAIESGNFPPYQTRMQNISAPHWAFYDNEEEDES